MRLLALGIVVAAAVASVPAVAQDVYVGGRGGGVDVGIGPRYHRDFDRDRDFHRDHRVYGYERDFRHCRTIIIRDGGMVRRIKRCD